MFKKTPALQRFAEKWSHPDTVPDNVKAEDLANLEADFEVFLPTDYKSQVVEFGLPHPTLALLSAITDKQVHINDVGDLHLPKVIMEETTSWREIGMPSSLIVIAGDCMGNKFCFDAKDLRTQTLNAPIYFWDHEFGTTKKIARSFTKWIEGYLGFWARDRDYRDIDQAERETT